MSKQPILRETQRWLTYAQRDLAAAEALSREMDSFPQQICFLCQQATEKSLKAALIYEQIDFPFRHDLDLLRNLLPNDWQTRTDHPKLTELTEWAVEARYPSLTEEPTVVEAQRALSQARDVLNSVQADLSRRGF